MSAFQPRGSIGMKLPVDLYLFYGLLVLDEQFKESSEELFQPTALRNVPCVRFHLGIRAGLRLIDCGGRLVLQRIGIHRQRAAADPRALLHNHVEVFQGPHDFVGLERNHQRQDGLRRIAVGDDHAANFGIGERVHVGDDAGIDRNLLLIEQVDVVQQLAFQDRLHPLNVADIIVQRASRDTGAASGWL